jgi:hypothetical protein
MITFFSIPKKFTGEFALIQENAILSWLTIKNSQVFLLGDEEGVANFANLNGIEYIKNIPTNTSGTPLLSEAFRIVKSKSLNDIIIYVNCDIIFTSSLLNTINVVSSRFQNYVIVGRRSDVFISKKIDFSNINWEKSLMNDYINSILLHSKSGIDYFIFPKNIEINMPQFAVGRPSWDNWMIYYFLKMKYPVIDSSNINLVLHQNHERGYTIYGEESKTNFNLAGGTINLCDISHSNFKFIKNQNQEHIIMNYYGVFKYFLPIRFLFSLRLDLINFYLEKIRKVK